MTIQKVYELVNTTRLELKGDIARLEQKFDTLEEGRLSRLDRDVANMQGKVTVYMAVVAILVNGLFLIFNFLLK